MGKRGPKKTPTAVLDARGSWRAKIRKAEPVALGQLARPRWLMKEAGAKFKQLAAQLESMNITGQIDTEALARYCDTWAWWRELRKIIKKEGQIYTGIDANDNTFYKTRPEANLALKLAAQLSKMEAEFGLTPAARASVKVNPQTKPNEKLKNRFFKKSG